MRAGNAATMNIRKIIERRVRHRREGVDVVADVNAVIAGNVGAASGEQTYASSRQSVVHTSRRARPERGAEHREEESRE